MSALSKNTWGTLHLYNFKKEMILSWYVFLLDLGEAISAVMPFIFIGSH